VKSVDDKAALGVAGVKQTAAIEAFKPPVGFQALGGVAVLADNTWAAMQGRKKLKIEWRRARTAFGIRMPTKRNCRKRPRKAGQGCPRERQRG